MRAPSIVLTNKVSVDGGDDLERLERHADGHNPAYRVRAEVQAHGFYSGNVALTNIATTGWTTIANLARWSKLNPCVITGSWASGEQQNPKTATGSYTDGT